MHLKLLLNRVFTCWRPLALLNAQHLEEDLTGVKKSPIASRVTVAIMRAFVSMRRFAFTYGQIVEKLNELDGKISEHDDVLRKVIQALSELVEQSQPE